MFGLSIAEKHYGYIGWRAILTSNYIDIVPNRGSAHGDKESQDRLIEWVNKPMKVVPPGKKRAIKVSPWKRMQDAADFHSGSRQQTWEYREGSFVLRANTNASYGYLYIALFELYDPAQRLRDVLKANPAEALAIAEAAVLGLVLVPDVVGNSKVVHRVINEEESYGSACDYLEHVDAHIQMSANVHEAIKQLQKDAEVYATT